MQSAVIELDFVESLRQKWREDTRAFDMERTDIQALPLTLKYMHTRWYNYTFTFGPRGNFLAFSDYPSHSLFGLEQHFAIYQICREDPLSVKLVKWTDSVISTPILRVAFHPTYDIVVFERGGTINLWYFQDDFHNRTITQNQDYEGYVPEFSDCGNYVLFNKQGLPKTV